MYLNHYKNIIMASETKNLFNIPHYFKNYMASWTFSHIHIELFIVNETNNIEFSKC